MTSAGLPLSLFLPPGSSGVPTNSEQLVPTICEKFWLGHAISAISDQYALQLLEDVEQRKGLLRASAWALKWRIVPAISTTVGWWRHPIGL